jgi:signal-transduction protein with cAMP-binding, CBS, and nucleotidyltransferase domain
VDSLEEVTFSKGGQFVTQGENKADDMIIVDSGILECLIDTGRILKVCKRGDYIQRQGIVSTRGRPNPEWVISDGTTRWRLRVADFESSVQNENIYDTTVEFIKEYYYTNAKQC